MKFFRQLGPGLITGAADDDPSGISTYSVAGVSAGYSMLWLALLSTPMMAVIQGMCARISLVTGVGLAAVVRKQFPRPIAYALAAIVIIANTLNVGADIGGMGAAARLIVPLPSDLWVVFFGVGLVVAQIWLKYGLLVRIFKWLTLALFAYVVTAFIVHVPWGTVLYNLVVPHVRFSRDWFATVVGVLGTTITPYLFFWQASLMIEDERAAGKTTIRSRQGTNDDELRVMHADVNVGMIYSNIVALFIIVTTAATLGAHGVHSIDSAQQAAQALRPLAGPGAELLFAIGMVGTGILAVPVLATSSAYVAAETFLFREGLDERPGRAVKFYATIALGVGIGIVMNLLGIDAIRALFWSAVLNGVAAIPLIVAIVWLASDKKIMGKWRSSPLARAWGWLTALIMAMATIAMIYLTIS